MNKASLTIFLYSLLIVAFSQQAPLPPVQPVQPAPTNPIVDVPAINAPRPVLVQPGGPNIRGPLEPVDVGPVGTLPEEDEWASEEGWFEEEGMFNEEYDNIEDVDWSSPPVLAEEPSLDGDVDPFKPVIINPEGDVVVTSESTI